MTNKISLCLYDERKLAYVSMVPRYACLCGATPSYLYRVLTKIKNETKQINMSLWQTTPSVFLVRQTWRRDD